MARIVALLGLVVLAPSMARAQDGERAEPQEPAEDPIHAGGDVAIEGGTYEPDQRGEHEERPRESTPEVEIVRASAGAASMEAASWTEGAPRFELELGLGGSLTRLHVDGEGLVRPSQSGMLGGALGLGAGVRMGPWLVGARLGLTMDPSFVLVSTALAVEAELLPSALTPYVRLALGPSFVTPLGELLPAQSDATILGIGAELAVGVRWNAGRGLLLGLEAAGAWHHLWRAGVADCTGACTDGPLDLRRAAESDSLSIRVSLSIGYRF